MVKVVIGYKVKDGADIQPILLKLRSHAMNFPGFVAAENLQSEDDKSAFAVIQTWEKAEDWKAWEPSTARQSVLDQARPLLAEEPSVKIYRVLPTTAWTYTPRKQ